MRLAKRRIAALAIAVPALIAAMATSASATSCPSGYSCTWEDGSYNTNGAPGGYIKFAHYIPVLGQHYYAGFPTISGQDNASSMHNNGSSQTVYYYMDNYCSGISFSRNAGSMDADFGNDTPGPNGQFNDELSSGAFSGYVSSC